MSTRSTLFQTPTIEIDQSRYEELIQKELKYKQYKEQATIEVIRIIEGQDSEKATEESEEITVNKHIYKKKATEVEAFELRRGILPNWFTSSKQIEQISCGDTEGLKIKIKTYLGYEIAREGDFIIKENNYIYACPKTLFKETYKKVEE